MSRRRGALVPGIFLVLLGLYFLAAQFNIPLPGFAALWPGLVLLGGLLFLADYAFGGRRDGGAVFTGVAATLAGIFFFFFTLRLPLPVPPLNDGVTWGDMARLWPVFVLIGGLALLAQWAVEPQNRGGRNVGALALLVGLAALAINFNASDQGLLNQLVRLWPVLLVAAGLQMLFQRYRRRPGGG